jgi:hypothetical protein
MVAPPRPNFDDPMSTTFLTPWDNLVAARNQADQIGAMLYKLASVVTKDIALMQNIRDTTQNPNVRARADDEFQTLQAVLPAILGLAHYFEWRVHMLEWELDNFPLNPPPDPVET